GTTVLAQEGAGQSVTGEVLDLALNQTSVSVAGINIDETPPTVQFTGNDSPYSVDQQVAITCSASDSLSGIATSTCGSIVGPAYSFPLGLNTYVASATDRAGNVGSAATNFVVMVTLDSLCALAGQFSSKP